MKKIHFTESQLRNILMEVTLSGDEALNATKNIQTAVKDTMASARQSGINVDNGGANVSFSADTLRKNGLTEETDENYGINPAEAAQKVVSEHMVEINNANNAKEIYAVIYDTIGDELSDIGVDVTDYRNDAKLATLFTAILKEIDKILDEQEEEELYECYTKKQLKEAKLRKMVSEAKNIYTKKDLIRK